MRAVIQRVTDASVRVDGQLIGSIDRGLLVYLGVYQGDSEKEVDYLVHKIINMRLFTDENGKMNLALKEIEGKLLVVSQFTLCADLSKGHRPSFNPAAEPSSAQNLYTLFVQKARSKGFEVETGSFGSKMKVSYTNEGPVTIVVDSHPN